MSRQHKNRKENDKDRLETAHTPDQHPPREKKPAPEEKKDESYKRLEESWDREMYS